jgi:hypothetical protein
VFVAAGIGASGVLLGATLGVGDGVLADHGLHAWAFDYEGGQRVIMTYGLFFPPAIMVGAMWSARSIGMPGYRLLALGWIVANVAGIGLSFGHGVANTILFEALVMDSIVVAVACQTLLEQRELRRSAFLLMLCAVWPVVLLPAALSDGPHEWEMLPRASLALQAGADAVPADVLACYAAGSARVVGASVA